MSDTHFTPTSPTARKDHQCIACLHKIPKGEKYTQQEGFYEGGPYRNRYHNECWDTICSDFADWGDFEFAAGDIDPPSRILKDKEPNND